MRIVVVVFAALLTLGLALFGANGPNAKILACRVTGFVRPLF